MKPDRTTFSLLLVLLLTAAAAILPAAAVDPPERLSYQGVLRSAAGAPLDGTYDMVFRFTDAPIGGTLLLTDFHTGPSAIDVDGGLFTAILGTGTLSPGIENSLQDIFGNYSPVYIEVQVGAETLSPRVEVVSTGFALNAGRFGGQLPGDYIDTSAADQVKQGAVTSNTGFITEPTATSGDVRGVNATTHSTAGIAVLGTSLAASGATEGVRGQSTSPGGIGVVGGAFAGSGATIGVFGESQSPDGTGIQGLASSPTGGTVGIGGENFSTIGTGVAGVARATSGEAWGVYGETASADGYGVVSIGDSITAGDTYATGTKFFLAEHPDRADSAIRFACLEGGEIGVYHRGGGRLEDGVARVELPEPFPLVASGRITVQVTPQEASGALYVPESEIDASGFTVRESGAASDAPFTYLVMAERRGLEQAEAVRPISLADKILTSPRLSVAEKAALRASLAPLAFDGAASPEEADRSELFEALHQGDFDGSCRLLGGCVPPGVVPVALDPGPSGSEPAPGPSTTAASHSELQGLVDRVAVGNDRAATGVGGAHSGRIPRIPPSSLATLHVVSEEVAPGEVVVLDSLQPGELRPGRDAHDRAVIGVVSFVEGSVPAGDPAPIAVAGVVPCRVDAGYGIIEAGDLLVVSPTPGHAMRADAPAPGTVLGKALESLQDGKGTIRVLLTLR